MRDRSVRLGTLVSLALLVLYCVSQLELSTSITHFMPTDADAKLAQLSLDLVDSNLVRQMVLSVEGGSEHKQVAAELSESLRGHPEVAWVQAGFSDEALQEIYEIYFERRVYLASQHPETEIPALLTSQALDGRAAELLSRLAGPDAMLVTRSAPHDPLGLVERVFERVRSFQPGEDESDRIASKRFSLIQLGLTSSPYDTKRQAPLLAFIESEFARIAKVHGGGLLLEQSGANRFALAAERSLRGDISLISTLSITVVCGLFLLVFQSLRHLLIAIITPAFGFALALAVTISTSNSIHGITMAFGCILIGVAIDYPIHLMSHFAMAKTGTTSREAVSRIRGSLLLSGATTTLAFFTLSLGGFPGLDEMGTFTAIGIPVSLFLTLFALPAFLPAAPQSTSVQLALRTGFIRLTELLGRHPGLLSLVPIGFIAIAVVGVPRLHWEDDPGKLLRRDVGLYSEVSRVQHRAGAFDSGRFVVSLADDTESALILNEQVYDSLMPLVGSGDIEGIGSLCSFLFSESLQRRNLSAFREALDLELAIDDAFVAHGFRPGSFATFSRAVERPAVEPLRAEDLRGTPLERVLASMVELDGRTAVVTLLKGVHSGASIREAIAGLGDVYYVDQIEIMSGVYEEFRRSTLRMIFIGALVVLAALQLRYRAPLRGLLAFMPAALGASTTLGLFGLFDVPVNVISAVSLLVVIGMGVDYGVFAVDAASDLDRQGSTLTSLLVSCLTSVSVLGVLAISSQPVLRALGLTTGIGVLLALILSPIALALAKRL